MAFGELNYRNLNDLLAMRNQRRSQRRQNMFDAFGNMGNRLFTQRENEAQRDFTAEENRAAEAHAESLAKERMDFEGKQAKVANEFREREIGLLSDAEERARVEQHLRDLEIMGINMKHDQAMAYLDRGYTLEQMAYAYELEQAGADRDFSRNVKFLHHDLLQKVAYLEAQEQLRRDGKEWDDQAYQDGQLAHSDGTIFKFNTFEEYDRAKTEFAAYSNLVQSREGRADQQFKDQWERFLAMRNDIGNTMWDSVARWDEELGANVTDMIRNEEVTLEDARALFNDFIRVGNIPASDHAEYQRAFDSWLAIADKAYPGQEEVIVTPKETAEGDTNVRIWNSYAEAAEDMGDLSQPALTLDGMLDMGSAREIESQAPDTVLPVEQQAWRELMRLPAGNQEEAMKMEEYRSLLEEPGALSVDALKTINDFLRVLRLRERRTE